MKLFSTPNSPYARIARVAAIEAGLDEGLEHCQAKLRSGDNPLLAYCPLGRVPALVDGELVLGQARTICAYFDGLTGKRQFFPDDSWQARSLEALTTGLLDGVAVWVRELRRPAAGRSGALLEVERARAVRCLDRLERELAGGALGSAWDFTAIQLACTLGIMAHSLGDVDWRAGRPALTAWFDARAARPSMAATAPLVAG